ncbi:hypothetical protein AAHE18_04G018900 [Arachis hypogaea]|uniref:Protein RALF-like 32 n=3 Tax=Arachis hypogaea TaxID=3818 RepID=A0A445DKI2_ARAHY|nr:hypothetical protein Ahy_A04g021482 isoform A [Arachis hypogaea]
MDSEYTIRFQNFCCFMIVSYMHLSTAVFSQTNHAYTYTCNGSIAECNQEYEMLMESEISRRFLEEKKYISYGALGRDKPACNGERGEAYSKNEGCLPPPSNPENRGCSKYYRCRSDS